MNIQLPLPSNSEIEQAFMDFLRVNNLAPVGNFRLVIDGTIQRYRLEGDKSGETSGSCCVYTDNGWPIGWAKDWHVGETINWYYKTDGLSQEQKDYLKSNEFKQKVKAAEARWEAQIKQKHNDAADNARSKIEALPDAPENHPYLQQ